MEKATTLDKFNGPFNARISERMKQLGMRKLEEFADRFDIGRTTVYNLVLGRVSSHGGLVKPSVDTLVKLADALDVPLHILVYELEPEAKGVDTFKEVPPVRPLDVGIAGWVGAGPDQDEEILDGHFYVEEDFARGKDLVAFRVRGDSMAAGKNPIYDGDIVIVNRLDKGRNTASVVAQLENNGYVCKVLKDDKFGRMLQSRNVDHTNGTPSAIPADLVAEIVGRVVRIIHDEVQPS